MSRENTYSGSPDAAIWIIEKTRHFRDLDNYEASESSVEMDEGFYLSKDAAEACAEERNASLLASYEHAERQRRLEHKRQSRAVMRHNNEAAAIRAAGMKKADMALRGPFVPRTLSEFRRNTDHVIYEAMKVQRAADDRSGSTDLNPAAPAS